MASLSTNPQENIQSRALITCETQQCSGHGDCVVLNGLAVCKCWLGYRGETCRDTVNDGLAVPLTLGILFFIVAFVILAFVLACIGQKRRERISKQTQPLGKNGDFYSSSIHKIEKHETPCL